MDGLFLIWNSWGMNLSNLTVANTHNLDQKPGQQNLIRELDEGER
jgi:hypothetical protein